MQFKKTQEGEFTYYKLYQRCPCRNSEVLCYTQCFPDQMPRPLRARVLVGMREAIRQEIAEHEAKRV